MTSHEITARAERDAMSAAYEVLSALVHASEPKDIGTGDYAKHVLLAVKAVRQVQTVADKLIPEEEDERVYLDVLHIVATALWRVTEGDDLSDDQVHPYSAGGVPFIGFAKAALALEAAANFELTIDDLDGECFDACVDETLRAISEREASKDARS